jgi:hypothetical protein
MRTHRGVDDGAAEVDEDVFAELDVASLRSSPARNMRATSGQNTRPHTHVVAAERWLNPRLFILLLRRDILRRHESAQERTPPRQLISGRRIELGLETLCIGAHGDELRHERDVELAGKHGALVCAQGWARPVITHDFGDFG